MIKRFNLNYHPGYGIKEIKRKLEGLDEKIS